MGNLRVYASILGVLVVACSSDGGTSAGGGGSSAQAGQGLGGASAGAGAGATNNGGAGASNAGSGGSAGLGGAGGAGSAGGAGGAGGAKPSNGVQDACKAYASSWCSRQATCSPIEQIKQYGTSAVCENRVQQGCVATMGLPGNGMGVADLNQCASYYSKVSCSAVAERQLPVVCSPLGKYGDGAICAHSWECSNNSRCDIGFNESCGHCKKVLPVGGACEVPEDCQGGLVCEFKKCALYKGEGDICIGSEDTCGPDLACAGLASFKSCDPAPSGGEACDPSGQSAPSSCRPSSKSYCDSESSTCLEYKILKPGEPCSVVGVTKVCAGSVCGGTCAPYKSDGDACSLSAECQPPAVCAGGVCALVNTACK